MKMNRRDFIRACGGTLLGAFASDFLSGLPADEVSGGVGRRRLGRTGRDVSVIAFGGIVVMNAKQERANQVVAEAFKSGVNYFDVAPSYGDAEQRLGPALKPFRDRSFLACKTTCRDRESARKELEGSLEHLQTDHFDLYQLHALTDVEKDVHAALGKGGAMEAVLEARKKGQLRFIGFSAHSPEAALAAMKEFDFDTVMYPINFVAHFQGRFDQEVLLEAKKRNMGIIALKSMAYHPWKEGEDRKAFPKCWYHPVSDPELARLALSWTLSQGASVAIPPGEEDLFRLAVSLAPKLRQPGAEEIETLKQAAAAAQPIFSA